MRVYNWQWPHFALSETGPMADDKLLRTGVIGVLLTALCCFTPTLVVALGAVGLASWAGVLDFVLFPLMALFFAMIGYAIYRRHSSA